MNTIAAVVPDLVATATPMRPDAPPRESNGPPVGPSIEVRRADGRAAQATRDHGSFATALAEQMDGDAAEPAAPSVERAPAAPAAAGAEDGDETPLDGNALPPWLAALPLAGTSTVPSGVVGDVPAGSAYGTLASAATAASAAPNGRTPDGVASTVPVGAALDDAAAGATLPGAELVTSAGVELASPAEDAARTSGKPPAAQARSDGAATADAAWQSANRAPATVAGDAPSSSTSDLARQVAAAVGRQGASGPSSAPAQLPSTAVELRAALAASGPSPATPLVGGPVAPALPSAVTAGLAVDGEPSADLASAPSPSPSFAASLAATPPPSPSANAPAPQIPVAVGAPDWDRQLGERVGVLVDQGLTNAQLKLSPAHLGPLEIRISVQNDQASVWFGTHSHATREALEAAAPRLRDMLGAQGFAHVGVSVDLQQQAQRQNTPSSRHEPEFSFAAGDAAAPGPSLPSGGISARTADRSRLDAFA
jgi:flagellar hook-length control protein FliK